MIDLRLVCFLVPRCGKYHCWIHQSSGHCGLFAFQFDINCYLFSSKEKSCDHSFKFLVNWNNQTAAWLTSRIERKYCLISTSHLAGLFDIFVLRPVHIWQNCVFWWLFTNKDTLWWISLTAILFNFVVCNPSQSSPSLTILFPLWFTIIISLAFFHLSKALFSGFLQFRGRFVDRQNTSKYRDKAPLRH